MFNMILFQLLVRAAVAITTIYYRQQRVCAFFFLKKLFFSLGGLNFFRVYVFWVHVGMLRCVRLLVVFFLSRLRKLRLLEAARGPMTFCLFFIVVVKSNNISDLACQPYREQLAAA